MAATAIVEDRTASRQTLTYAAIMIVVGVFATSLAQPQVLGRLPLQNLLKNELHVGRSANAAFFFLAGLPWYFKPVAGLLTDAFPLFGSRRRSYLVVSTVLAVAAWVGLYYTPHQYNPLLWTVILINLFMVTASVVIGGYMVETAQAVAGSGRLTALREFVQQLCTIIRGPAAGYLASIAFGWTAAACGGVMFLLAPVTILFLREQNRRIDSREMLDNAARQLGRIGAAGTMWGAAALMALFYVAPGIITALFYKQQNDLHMSPQGQGTLALIFGLCGVAAAVGYGYACRRVNLRTLLIVCLLAASLGRLSYLFYSSVGRAHVIAGIDGFSFTLAELALMDLAVRATPAGSEGLGFSLLMSVRNFALFGTDWLGSTLIDTFHFKFNALVAASAATMLVTVPLVLLLPRMLVRRKDAELYEEAPAPAEAIQA
ncbi:MAG TPA: MFS transporter [Caulobacteraceae bacterium]|jgi:predicted MFS family arabinose efflux permease